MVLFIGPAKPPQSRSTFCDSNSNRQPGVAVQFSISIKVTGRVLVGNLPVNDSQIADETGIPRRTFQRQRERIWGIVKREFDALPEPRGRGGRG
jgi:hypothetical protein